MANTKKWIISSLECKPSENGLTNVVTGIHWRKQATEDINGKSKTVDLYNVCAVPDASNESFVAFESLTEEIIISWLEAILDIESINNALDAKLEDYKNPPLVQKRAPWMPALNPDIIGSETVIE